MATFKCSRTSHFECITILSYFSNFINGKLPFRPKSTTFQAKKGFGVLCLMKRKARKSKVLKGICRMLETVKSAVRDRIFLWAGRYSALRSENAAVNTQEYNRLSCRMEELGTCIWMLNGSIGLIGGNVYSDRLHR